MGTEPISVFMCMIPHHCTKFEENQLKHLWEMTPDGLTEGAYKDLFHLDPPLMRTVRGDKPPCQTFS